MESNAPQYTTPCPIPYNPSSCMPYVRPTLPMVNPIIGPPIIIKPLLVVNLNCHKCNGTGKNKNGEQCQRCLKSKAD